MPRQLKRLIGPTQLGANKVSESSLCTPATGTRAVLRHIKATNCDTSATHYLCMSIGTDDVGNRIIDQIPIAANAEYDRWGSYVVEAGEVLCSSADTASKIALTVNGDLITLG